MRYIGGNNCEQSSVIQRPTWIWMDDIYVTEQSGPLQTQRNGKFFYLNDQTGHFIYALKKISCFIHEVVKTQNTKTDVKTKGELEMAEVQ